MDIESKIIQTDEGILLRTTTVESRAITDSIEVVREIGRQRLWACTKVVIGLIDLAGTTILAGILGWVTVGKVIESAVKNSAAPIDLGATLLVTGLFGSSMLGGFYLLKDGYIHLDKLQFQDLALKNSTSIAPFQELPTPVEPAVAIES